MIERGQAVESWGEGRRFGYLPVDADRIYWFAADVVSPGTVEDDDLRNHLISRFSPWHHPVADILQRTAPSDIVHSKVCDLRPFSPWGRGRVTLLGDAAHPMTPNYGQGGGQAIEDAVVLAKKLDGAPDVERALRQYERGRQIRTRSFVNESRLFGRLAQGENAFMRLSRNLLFRMIPEAVNHARLRRMLTFSA